VTLLAIGDSTIRTQTIHGVSTPVEPVAHAGNCRIWLTLYKHAFRSQPFAEISALLLIGHSYTSIPAARKIALLAATRAN
jgi:hypothetical protein